MRTITTKRRRGRSVAPGSRRDPSSVEDLARRQVAEKCAYAFCFNEITFRYAHGTLILQGRLPSFYLKQVLQTLLRDLDGVARIDNRVDVVNSTGLSSVRVSPDVPPSVPGTAALGASSSSG